MPSVRGLVASRATTGLEPMEAVGKTVPRAVAEEDHSRNPGRPPPEALGMVIDDSLVDRLAHRRARIQPDIVDTAHAAFGSPSEDDSRNRRRYGHRTSGRRVVRRHVQSVAGYETPARRRTNPPEPERFRIAVRCKEQKARDLARVRVAAAPERDVQAVAEGKSSERIEWTTEATGSANGLGEPRTGPAASARGGAAAER